MRKNNNPELEPEEKVDPCQEENVTPEEEVKVEEENVTPEEEVKVEEENVTPEEEAEPDPEKEEEKPSTLKEAIVISNRLNVRSKPDKTSDILCVISKNDVVTVNAVVNNWARVYTDKDIKGYVMKEFIEEV